MQRIFLFLLFIGFQCSLEAETVLRGTQAHATIPGTQVLRYYDGVNIPAYIQFNPAQQIGFHQWEAWMKAQFFSDRPELKFELIGQEVDRLGMVHYRYQQQLHGHPIAMSYWIVHTLNGVVVSMNGWLTSSRPDQNVQLSKDAALQKALSLVQAELYAWEDPSEEALLRLAHGDQSQSYRPIGELTYVPADGKMRTHEQRLAWKFDIYALQPLSRQELYLDAMTGDLLMTNDLIHHADSNSIAATGYSGQREIVSDFTGSQFRLQETGRGNGIQTFDLNNGTSGLGVDFFHPDNYWDTTTVDRFATDAHWGAEMTYDYFYNHFNRNSINNNGFTLVSRVHYGTNYANAFWNGSVMTYGDGSSGNAPFTAVDIAGHEIGHGLTTFTANLVYQYEPGALNESFSDIFGTAIEFDALGSGSADWLIGEDLGFVIRSMSNPNAYGDPDTYHGQNWSFSSQDNGGVHTNSGVQNFWFYLLATGGSGVNDIGHNYSVEGVGLDAAGAIAYRNLTTYLGVNSQYDDARFYAIQAAYDLYGPCSQEAASTANAWHAVGIGYPYSNSITADFIPSSTGHCAVPHTVHFQNTSSHATSYQWNFGDGTTSSATHPNKTYSQAGTYTVTLIVQSSCGSDTLIMPDLIQVGPGAPCEVLMQSNTSNQFLSACYGSLLDDGGATGNYSDDVNHYVTIHSQGAANITLNFAQFNVQPGASVCVYDYLEVFDGVDPTAPSIGKYCNSNPPPASLTSSEDVVTVKFFSNSSYNFGGFKIDWACNAPTAPPNTEFEADVTQTCDGLVYFSDLSSNGADGWSWDFGDGSTDTVQHPSHVYSQSGTYSVTLIASNAVGSDTLVLSNLVSVVLAEAPNGEDDDICPGEQGTLIAEGPGEHRWYISALGNSVLHIGDTFVTPIVQQSTAYYVEAMVESSARGVGPASNAFGSGGYLPSPQVMYFDVFEECVLESVKVYAYTGGTRTFILLDANDDLIADTSMFLSPGEHVVPLEFLLNPGSDYQLGISPNSTVNLYRNTSGADYPYSMDGVLSITQAGGTAPNESYFFFYDWQVRARCISERSILAASTGICTGIAERYDGLFKVFPNPNQGHFTFEGNLQSGVMSIFDHTGRLVLSQVIGAQNSVQVNLAHCGSGIYLLEYARQDGVVQREKLILQ